MSNQFDELKEAMQLLATSKPGEYSGPDSKDGTVSVIDPVLESPAPTKPPVTIAQRAEAAGLTKQQPSFVENPAPAVAPEVSLGGVAAASTSRLVFTGVSGAGKSWLTQQLGMQEVQIQDSIAALYQEFFPGQEPALDFVNTLLVWGEGVIDPKTPVTPARILFVEYMRQRSPGFGERGFWQHSLLRSVGLTPGGVVVTTCTSQGLLDDLKSQGFQHLHVMSSAQTLVQRKRRQGANDALGTGLSQQLIREISMRPQGQQLPCVWNDTVPAPSPRFFTLGSVKSFLQSTQSSIITGE